MNCRRVVAVTRLELRIQRREPLTVLYMLVLSLLAAAFAAAGPVELVRDRGAVPRDAPWALMLASTALTAFGQVITTMVAATVVLRDRADRVSDLLAATRVTGHEYLTGKLMAALAMLLLIYTAIPLGLIVGALVGGGELGAALPGALRPFIVVVLPTMLTIGALQFAVGVLSGRLWTIVGQGLILIWVWTACAGAAAQADNSWMSVLDPFASAPLLEATSGWSDAERMTLMMPVTTLLVLNRLGWFLVAAIAATIAVRRGVPPRTTPVTVTMPVTAERIATGTQRQPTARAAKPAPLAGCVGTALHSLRWMIRDAGWRVLTVLGVLNVGVHAVIDAAGASGPAPATGHAVQALLVHSRLFLILLATIYAGELLWREREDRSAAFFDSAPIPTIALHGGRMLGVVLAQCIVAMLLTVSAAAGSAIGCRCAVTPDLLVLAGVQSVLLPFVSWMMVALAVHVAVQQKVVAHLVCIAGWVLGVLLLGAADGGTRAPTMIWPILIGGMLSAALALALWRRGDGRCAGQQ